MKKLLLLSGKGGTGKTTAAAAFIRFAEARAYADCDVDAPNLHLIVRPDTAAEESAYLGSPKAVIHSGACIGCGRCMDACRFNAIRRVDGVYTVEAFACEGCGVCGAVCPTGAATLTEDVAGTLSLYRGEKVFSTATLHMGRGNSGKLVAEVKKKLSAAVPKTPLAIIDGSPGVGCPVIASISGVDLVLIVAEPSLSGFSDMQRILKTAAILQAQTAVCINKHDTSPRNAEAIRQYCLENGIPFMGLIPYDLHVPEAVNAGISIADIPCPARDALYGVYQNTMALLGDDGN